MLAAAPSPRGSDANLSIVGYVVGGFHDESLPSRHGSADGAARLMNYSFLQTINSATSGHSAKVPIALTILLPRLGQCDQKGSKMIWAQLPAYVTCGAQKPRPAADSGRSRSGFRFMPI